MPQRVSFDTLRIVANGAISGSYTALGAALSVNARLICITNNTDGDMFISTDGTNNMLFIPKTSFKLFDLNSNRNKLDPDFQVAIGVQFYVKQSSAPSTGSVYLEVIYGS